MNNSQTSPESPFHTGEQQVQDRLGVREKIDVFARRVVRDHLPDQHREFYAELPFLLLGSVDEKGRPWASLVAGRPGFMASPEARALHISGAPLFGDPLERILKPGAEVGALGIDLKARRRNRLTGRIASLGPDGFTISIRQTFGNCPQYIQAREVEVMPDPAAAGIERPVSRSDRFDETSRRLIEKSDTLFIATAYSAEQDNWSHGADVSHRGGKPGFIKVEDDRTFVFPDFSGNNHFNTVGNILLNPRAGFLFLDFATRDLLYMTGDAEIVWDGDGVRAFAGAERLIRFHADEVIRVEGSLPISFTFGDYSPLLERSGDWAQTAEIVAAEKERNLYLPYEVSDIRSESETITSFLLRRADGKALPSCEPGQFLPIRLRVPGEESPVARTYTLSNAPGDDHYRLSIKREPRGGLVSNFFHAQVETGFQLEAMGPLGKFVLDRSSDRPAVLISAGVGITPMIAMTNFIINEGRRTRNFRRTYFVHGARNGQQHAFGSQMRALASAHESLTVHIRYSNPDSGDRLGSSHDSEGHVDLALLKQLLPFDDYDFYLCGPAGFMQSIYDDLTGLGVRDARIHYESFGPATLLKHDAKPTSRPAAGEAADGPVMVSFAASGMETEWSPDKGTLLDLAEAAGLNPAFSCRSGICGTCATRVTCGKVDYIEEPSAPHGEDEVLICCSTPRSLVGASSCGKDHGIVLDL